ncbi:MAG TPA: serine/threonine-protein kinase, partial [Pirellulales bacterium]
FHRRAVDQWLQETNFGSPTWTTLKSNLPGVGPGTFNELGGFAPPAPAEAPAAGSYEELIAQLEAGGLLLGDVGRRRRLFLDHEPTREVDQLMKRLTTERLLTDYQAAMVRHGRSVELRYDDYVVLEKIGAGGMAIVYKAIQPLTGHVVAIKVLSSVKSVGADEEFRRFDREVRAAAKLDHPNIIMAYDAVFREGRNYLVLEFVDGPNLDVLIRRNGPLEVPVAVDYLLQAAKGFEHAHSKHLIHRDIKPGNLLVDSLGTVKILDMGLVRIDQAWSTGSSMYDRGDRLTTSEMVLGTPEFMAPEQFLDAREADARSDVYSLGCTFYYLLTGRTPYQSGSPTRTLRAHQNEPIPSLRATRSEIPVGVEAVYQKMMQKNPVQRYQSMDELVHDLEQRVIPELQELGFSANGQGGAGSLAGRGSSIWSREKIEGSGIKGLPPDFKTAREAGATGLAAKTATTEFVLVVFLGVAMGSLSGIFCWWAFTPDLARGAEICAAIGAAIGAIAGGLVYWWKRD